MLHQPCIMFSFDLLIYHLHSESQTVKRFLGREGGWGLEGKITHSASGLCCGDKAPHSSKWKSMKLILALFENREEAVLLLTSLETQSCVIPKKTWSTTWIAIVEIYRPVVSDYDSFKQVSWYLYQFCRFSLVVVTVFWGMIHPIRLSLQPI